jgi:hypothetical protein
MQIHAFNFPQTDICLRIHSYQQITYKIYYEPLKHIFKTIEWSSYFRLYSFDAVTSFEKTNEYMYIKPWLSSRQTVPLSPPLAISLSLGTVET